MQHHVGLAVTPQHDVNARPQLGQRKGLDDIVLRAELQALDAVGHRVLGRDKDNRNLERPDVWHQFEPVQPGQHHVQQNQVIPVALEQVGGFQPILGAGTGKAVMRQRLADERGDRFFVLHDQNLQHHNPHLLSVSMIPRFGKKTAKNYRLVQS